MKYSDLSDKDRYDVIKAGVKAGYTSLDDIEKYYNEFANAGHVFATKGQMDFKTQGRTDYKPTLNDISPAQQFNNAIWNSDIGLITRESSGDPKIIAEAEKERERQKLSIQDTYKRRMDNIMQLIDEGKISPADIAGFNETDMPFTDEDKVKLYRKMADKGMISNGVIFGKTAKSQKEYWDKLGDEDLLKDINRRENLTNKYDDTQYDSGIAKMVNNVAGLSDKWFGADLKTNKWLPYVDMAAGVAEAVPIIGAINAGGSIGSGDLKNAGSSALMAVPSTKGFKAENALEKAYKGVTGTARLGRDVYYGAEIVKMPGELSNLANTLYTNKNPNTVDGYMNNINKFKKENPNYFDEQGNVLPGALSYIQKVNPQMYDFFSREMDLQEPKYKNNFIDVQLPDGTIQKVHSPVKPIVDKQVADNKAATQTTTASTSTPTQTTNTKVRVPASMQTPKQQITQQPVQQQVTQQKPTKIQGFMNKLGSAAPYIGDFVGWTLGNSKFFKYGGNIYETKNLH